jgi:hypothetical protein
MLTRSEVEEIAARAEAASVIRGPVDNLEWSRRMNLITDFQGHALTDVPALIATVRELREALKETTELCRGCWNTETGCCICSPECHLEQRVEEMLK